MNVIKKHMLSLLVALTLGSYVVYKNTGQVIINNVSNPPTPMGTHPKTQVSTMMGNYKNGIYTGNITDAYYGNMQVQVMISMGNITAVNVLDSPKGRSRSVIINNNALPVLKQEVITAQSTKIKAVSGASYSSPAFVESLATALAQAKT